MRLRRFAQRIRLADVHAQHFALYEIEQRRSCLVELRPRSDVMKQRGARQEQ